MNIYHIAAAILAAGTMALPAVAQQSVELRFDARVGNEPLLCDKTYVGVGQPAASMALQDFRVYVSAVRLIDAQGQEVPVQLTNDGQWQGDGVALLDFEDATGNCNGNAAMNRSVRGTVPPGRYRGLIFEIGVPQQLNHQDPTLAGAPLNVTAMTWPWRMGYKYTTIDLETSGGAGAANQATGFSIHLGSTGCGAGSPVSPPTAPCVSDNRATYRLDTYDSAASVVVLDLGALLAATNVTVNQPGSTSGCMSSPKDDDCIALMDRLGLSFRDKPSAGQKWVRAD